MPASSGSTSPSLLDGLRAEQPGAWEAMVELYAPLVLSWCRRGPLTEADAADVFQDVFQTVAAKLDQFELRGPRDSFRAWLRAITRSRVADHLRKAAREPAGRGGSTMQQSLQELALPEEPDELPAGLDPALRAFLRRGLDRVRPQVRDRTWLAFWRTVVEDRPHADVAEELGMTPGAVRVAKCRVLQRLRAALDGTV